MKSKVGLCTIKALILWLSPLLAYSSLLLSENEIKLINQNLFPSSELENPQDLFLSGIIYVDANHWTLWLNNKIVCPTSLYQINKFHIKKVMPQGVEFSWTPHLSTKPITFTLRVNQLYLIKENTVIPK